MLHVAFLILASDLPAPFADQLMVCKSFGSPGMWNQVHTKEDLLLVAMITPIIKTILD